MTACLQLKELASVIPIDDDFVKEMIDCQVGELVVNSVDNDGLMNGFDADLINHVTKISNLPIIAVGGGGNLEHYSDLFSKSNIKAVGSSSITRGHSCANTFAIIAFCFSPSESCAI